MKDACATPRRPINDTDDPGCARNVSNACAQISVSASASASFNNALAQSIATFPTPITAGFPSALALGPTPPTTLQARLGGAAGDADNSSAADQLAS